MFANSYYALRTGERCNNSLCTMLIPCLIPFMSSLLVTERSKMPTLPTDLTEAPLEMKASVNIWLVRPLDFEPNML